MHSEIDFVALCLYCALGPLFLALSLFVLLAIWPLHQQYFS